MRLTRRQTALKRLHGDPEEFTDAVIAAIGDITTHEALTAIRKYRREWREAGWKSKESGDAGTDKTGGRGDSDRRLDICNIPGVERQSAKDRGERTDPDTGAPGGGGDEAGE